MNKEVKNKWIAALRSGDYSQTTGALKDYRGYCCWGVLCDLYQKEHSTAKWEPPTGPVGVSKFDDGVEVKNGVPPRSVMTWAGIDNDADGGDIEMLIEANDGAGRARCSFTEIADLIDVNL